MGTMARLYVVGGPASLEARLRRSLDGLERLWSRFIDESEICRLNAAGGGAVAVSELTMLLVQRAIAASRATAGAFDPLVLSHVERIGYTETFALMPPAPTPLVATRDHRDPERVTVRSWAGAAPTIAVDLNKGTVTLPASSRFDPGGIGKGLAADLVVAQALENGATSVLVDIGGDICVGGTPPASGWQVAIESPFVPEQIVGYVSLPWGAIATSSTAARRWRSGDTTNHHIVDPQTGAPAMNGTVAATVVAGQGWRADALANAAVVMGAEDALEMLGSNGVEGMLVKASGQLLFTPAMAAAVSEVAA